jgi:sulfite exporter TauE/SafE
MPDLLLVFAAGLLGSAHCLGMCGGFVLAIANGQDTAARLQWLQTLYFLGKTITYALLGALVGAFGAVLSAQFTGIQHAVSIVAGVVMIVIGLGLIGLLRRFEGSAVWSRLPGLSKAMGAFLRRGGTVGTLGLGVLNGLLPCGLVYGLLVKAASTGSAGAGALTMAAFGLGTIPALYLLGVSGYLLRPVWRSRLNVVSGLVVVALGLITLLRGTPAMDALMSRLPGGHTEHEAVEHAQPPSGHPPAPDGLP